MRLLACVLACLIAAPAVAEPLPEEAARTAASAWLGSQMNSDVITIETREVLSWPAGARVRTQARAHGIPVVGAEQVLALDPSGRVLKVYGDPIPTGPVDLSGDVTEERALEWGRTVAGWHGVGELWPAKAERRVLARDGGLTLIWEVDASAAQPLGAWRLWIDASTGVLITWFPTMYTGVGNIYPGNPQTSDVAEVEIEGLWQPETLLGSYAIARSCTEVEQVQGQGNQCVEKAEFAVGDADGNFPYDPEAGAYEDPFAEVNMYWHIDFIHRWFEERYGFSHPVPMEGIVNFETANAFYGNFDGDPNGEIAFGQTGNIDFAYDADVIYHEFMHSVFGQIVNPGFIGADEFGLQWSAGGLNEGSADVLSMVHSGDPQLGEYAGSAFVMGSAPIRDLEADRRCPLDLYGEVHRDGEVWASLGWNLIERIGAEPTADVFYGAITTFPSDVDWGFAGQALLDAAAELLDAGVFTQEQHDGVIEEATRSGVAGCGRVNPLDDGDAPVQLMINVGFFAGAKLPLGQQFSLDAPEGATELRFRVDSLVSNEPNMGWVLHGRRGEHVRHDLVEFDTFFGTLEIPIAGDFDFEIEGEGGDYELVLNAESDPPLEPGATYYFSVASRQLGTIDGFANGELTVSGDVDIDPIDVAQGDDDDASIDEGTGCAGCSAGGGAGWLGLLVLGVRRRR
jgi:hypothetical protein